MRMGLRDVISRYIGMQTMNDKKLPARLSYAIAYNTEILGRETKRVDEMKEKLIEQYAKRDEVGEIVVVEKNGQVLYELGENKETFINEYEEFLDSEVELAIRTVSEDVIDKCDDPKYDMLNAGEISNLLFMID